ncbi:hypothetical protein [Holospora elegans]|uniref:hypothetical protein n=1 Tax=Holospora elegans TaxID=431043 RepID=UPI0013922CE4|nr:hypothetical protein [Holospora elegans]
MQNFQIYANTPSFPYDMYYKNAYNQQQPQYFSENGKNGKLNLFSKVAKITANTLYGVARNSKDPSLANIAQGMNGVAGFAKAVNDTRDSFRFQNSPPYDRNGSYYRKDDQNKFWYEQDYDTRDSFRFQNSPPYDRNGSYYRKDDQNKFWYEQDYPKRQKRQKRQNRQNRQSFEEF